VTRSSNEYFAWLTQVSQLSKPAELGADSTVTSVNRPAELDASATLFNPSTLQLLNLPSLQPIKVGDESGRTGPSG
jgi:hypothetical protein